MAAHGHFNADRLTGYEVLAAETLNSQSRLLLDSDGGIFQQAYDAAWKFTGLVNLTIPLSQLTPEQIGQLETASWRRPLMWKLMESEYLGTPLTILETIIKDKGLVTLRQ